MIHLKDLTEKDIGRGVIYDYNSNKPEFGLIKSWNKKLIFVVYNCGENWDKFQDYTGAGTTPSDLRFASYEEFHSKTPNFKVKETSRFELIDFD